MSGSPPLDRRRPPLQQQGSDSPPPERKRPPLQPLNKSINSAFEAYEKPPSPHERAPPNPRDRIPASPRDRGPPSPRDRGPLARDRLPTSPFDRTPPSPRERTMSGSRLPPSPRDRAPDRPPPPSPRDRAAPPSPRDRAPPSPRDRGSPGLLERAISSPKDFSPLSPKLPRVPPPSPVFPSRLHSQGSQDTGHAGNSKSNVLKQPGHMRVSVMLLLPYEPVCEKNNNLGFQQGPTQTGLYSHRRWLEA